MLASASRSSLAAAPRAPRRAAVRARAEQPEQASTSSSEPAAGTVFYGGNTYSESEFADAQKTGQYKPAPATPQAAAAAAAAAAAEPPTIGGLMRFDGPAPEVINGRLAMLGFVAAIGAEISTGESLFSQISEAPTGILLTFITIAIASLLPMTANVKPEDKSGSFWSAGAEVINGRAAMLGFVALIITELARGGQALIQ